MLELTRKKNKKLARVVASILTVVMFISSNGSFLVWGMSEGRLSFLGEPKVANAAMVETAEAITVEEILQESKGNNYDRKSVFSDVKTEIVAREVLGDETIDILNEDAYGNTRASRPGFFKKLWANFMGVFSEDLKTSILSEIDSSDNKKENTKNNITNSEKKINNILSSNSSWDKKQLEVFNVLNNEKDDKLNLMSRFLIHFPDRKNDRVVKNAIEVAVKDAVDNDSEISLKTFISLYPQKAFTLYPKYFKDTSLDSEVLRNGINNLSERTVVYAHEHPEIFKGMGFGDDGINKVYELLQHKVISYPAYKKEQWKIAKDTMEREINFVKQNPDPDDTPAYNSTDKTRNILWDVDLAALPIIYDKLKEIYNIDDDSFDENLKESLAERAIWTTRNLSFSSQLPTEENIKNELKEFNVTRNKVKDVSLLAGRKVVLLANAENRFANWNVQKAIERQAGEANVSFIRAVGDAVNDEVIIDRALKIFSETNGPATFIFVGHGREDDRLLVNKENTSLSAEDLFEAYKKKWEGKEPPKKLEDRDILVLGSCFSANFMRKFLDLCTENNIPKPIVAGESEYGQYGISEMSSDMNNYFFEKVLSKERSTLQDVIDINFTNPNTNPSLYVPDEDENIRQVTDIKQYGLGEIGQEMIVSSSFVDASGDPIQLASVNNSLTVHNGVAYDPQTGQVKGLSAEKYQDYQEYKKEAITANRKWYNPLTWNIFNTGKDHAPITVEEYAKQNIANSDFRMYPEFENKEYDQKYVNNLGMRQSQDINPANSTQQAAKLRAIEEEKGWLASGWWDTVTSWFRSENGSVKQTHRLTDKTVDDIPVINFDNSVEFDADKEEGKIRILLSEVGDDNFSGLREYSDDKEVQEMLQYVTGVYNLSKNVNNTTEDIFPVSRQKHGFMTLRNLVQSLKDDGLSPDDVEIILTNGMPSGGSITDEFKEVLQNVKGIDIISYSGGHSKAYSLNNQGRYFNTDWDDFQEELSSEGIFFVQSGGNDAYSGSVMVASDLPMTVDAPGYISVTSLKNDNQPTNSGQGFVYGSNYAVNPRELEDELLKEYHENSIQISFSDLNDVKQKIIVIEKDLSNLQKNDPSNQDKMDFLTGELKRKKEQLRQWEAAVNDNKSSTSAATPVLVGHLAKVKHENPHCSIDECKQVLQIGISQQRFGDTIDLGNHKYSVLSKSEHEFQSYLDSKGNIVVENRDNFKAYTGDNIIQKWKRGVKKLFGKENKSDLEKVEAYQRLDNSDKLAFAREDARLGKVNINLLDDEQYAMIVGQDINSRADFNGVRDVKNPYGSLTLAQRKRIEEYKQQDGYVEGKYLNNGDILVKDNSTLNRSMQLFIMPGDTVIHPDGEIEVVTPKNAEKFVNLQPVDLISNENISNNVTVSSKTESKGWWDTVTSWFGRDNKVESTDKDIATFDSGVGENLIGLDVNNRKTNQEKMAELEVDAKSAWDDAGLTAEFGSLKTMRYEDGSQVLLASSDSIITDVNGNQFIVNKEGKVSGYLGMVPSVENQARTRANQAGIVLYDGDEGYRELVRQRIAERIFKGDESDFPVDKYVIRDKDNIQAEVEAISKSSSPKNGYPAIQAKQELEQLYRNAFEEDLNFYPAYVPSKDLDEDRKRKLIDKKVEEVFEARKRYNEQSAEEVAEAVREDQLNKFNEVIQTKRREGEDVSSAEKLYQQALENESLKILDNTGDNGKLQKIKLEDNEKLDWGQYSRDERIKIQNDKSNFTQQAVKLRSIEKEKGWLASGWDTVTSWFGRDNKVESTDKDIATFDSYGETIAGIGGENSLGESLVGIGEDNRGADQEKLARRDAYVEEFGIPKVMRYEDGSQILLADNESGLLGDNPKGSFLEDLPTVKTQPGAQLYEDSSQVSGQIQVLQDQLKKIENGGIRVSPGYDSRQEAQEIRDEIYRLQQQGGGLVTGVNSNLGNIANSGINQDLEALMNDEELFGFVEEAKNNLPICPIVGATTAIVNKSVNSSGPCRSWFSSVASVVSGFGNTISKEIGKPMIEADIPLFSSVAGGAIDWLGGSIKDIGEGAQSYVDENGKVNIEKVNKDLNYGLEIIAIGFGLSGGGLAGGAVANEVAEYVTDGVDKGLQVSTLKLLLDPKYKSSDFTRDTGQYFAKLGDDYKDSEKRNQLMEEATKGAVIMFAKLGASQLTQGIDNLAIRSVAQGVLIEQLPALIKAGDNEKEVEKVLAEMEKDIKDSAKAGIGDMAAQEVLRVLGLNSSSKIVKLVATRLKAKQEVKKVVKDVFNGDKDIQAAIEDAVDNMDKNAAKDMEDLMKTVKNAPEAVQKALKDKLERELNEKGDGVVEILKEAASLKGDSAVTKYINKATSQEIDRALKGAKHPFWFDAETVKIDINGKVQEISVEAAKMLKEKLDGKMSGIGVEIEKTELGDILLVSSTDNKKEFIRIASNGQVISQTDRIEAELEKVMSDEDLFGFGDGEVSNGDEEDAKNNNAESTISEVLNATGSVAGEVAAGINGGVKTIAVECMDGICKLGDSFREYLEPLEVEEAKRLMAKKSKEKRERVAYLLSKDLKDMSSAEELEYAFEVGRITEDDYKRLTGILNTKKDQTIEIKIPKQGNVVEVKNIVEYQLDEGEGYSRNEKTGGYDSCNSLTTWLGLFGCQKGIEYEHNSGVVIVKKDDGENWRNSDNDTDIDKASDWSNADRDEINKDSYIPVESNDDSSSPKSPQSIAPARLPAENPRQGGFWRGVGNLFNFSSWFSSDEQPVEEPRESYASTTGDPGIDSIKSDNDEYNVSNRDHGKYDGGIYGDDSSVLSGPLSNSDGSPNVSLLGEIEGFDIPESIINKTDNLVNGPPGTQFQQSVTMRDDRIVNEIGSDDILRRENGVNESSIRGVELNKKYRYVGNDWIECSTASGQDDARCLDGSEIINEYKKQTDILVNNQINAPPEDGGSDYGLHTFLDELMPVSTRINLRAKQYTLDNIGQGIDSDKILEIAGDELIRYGVDKVGTVAFGDNEGQVSWFGRDIIDSAGDIASSLAFDNKNGAWIAGIDFALKSSLDAAKESGELVDRYDDGKLIVNGAISEETFSYLRNGGKEALLAGVSDYLNKDDIIQALEITGGKLAIDYLDKVATPYLTDFGDSIAQGFTDDSVLSESLGAGLSGAVIAGGGNAILQTIRTGEVDWENVIESAVIPAAQAGFEAYNGITELTQEYQTAVEALRAAEAAGDTVAVASATSDVANASQNLSTASDSVGNAMGYVKVALAAYEFFSSDEPITVERTAQTVVITGISFVPYVGWALAMGLDYAWSEAAKPTARELEDWRANVQEAVAPSLTVEGISNNDMANIATVAAHGNTSQAKSMMRSALSKSSIGKIANVTGLGGVFESAVAIMNNRITRMNNDFELMELENDTEDGIDTGDIVLDNATNKFIHLKNKLKDCYYRGDKKCVQKTSIELTSARRGVYNVTTDKFALEIKVIENEIFDLEVELKNAKTQLDKERLQIEINRAKQQKETLFEAGNQMKDIIYSGNPRGNDSTFTEDLIRQKEAAECKARGGSWNGTTCIVQDGEKGISLDIVGGGTIQATEYDNKADIASKESECTRKGVYWYWDGRSCVDKSAASNRR